MHTTKGRLPMRYAAPDRGSPARAFYSPSLHTRKGRSSMHYSIVCATAPDRGSPAHAFYSPSLHTRKGRSSMRYSSRLWFVTIGVLLILWAWSSPAEALPVTELDFTSGAANFTGQNSRILDRLFAEDGTIKMGSFQSMSDIVDPITRGHKTFSLFTSGLNGAPPPSGTVNGTSISVNLSSLFFGWTRGSEVHALNIGGL